MLGSYLVDPKDHCVFQVKRQLLGGTEVGKTLDTRHHFFYAEHLHYIGHHQGINKVDVGALEEQGLCVVFECYIRNIRKLWFWLAVKNVKMTFTVVCHKHKHG